MPSCCIQQCNARKNKHRPELTLHRFPVNEILKKKWMDNIGIENINPRHKMWYVCSMHFDESCFNKTLDVIRLHDGAVPSMLLPSKNIPSKAVLSEIQIKSVSACPLELEVSNYNLTKNVPCAKIPQGKEKIKFLTKKCYLLQQKVRSLKEKVRRRDGKIALFSNIIKDLQKKRFINSEQTLILEECAGPEDFLKRQIAKSKGFPLEKKYSEEIRKFALTLHFFSPKAYEFIRSTYNTCLPHSRTLSKWYQHVDAEPGFTKEAFEALKIKVGESVHPVICALTLDEMAIRKGLTWDPRAQKFYGRVDCGHDLNSDSVDEASQCLVLLVTSVNGSWKLPIGYFLIVSITGEQKATIVRTAIQLCQDAGVKVVSVTCDGLAGNFSMLTSLGCNVLKNQTTTKFKSHDSQIHVFIDPCHAIKLVRNAFGELRIFVDSMGREINFKYLELLLNLQEQKGLHLATKIGKAHILFEKQKMKVKLATQLLSSSVADALEFCCNKLKIKEFKQCGGTINFINIMNDVFDVLNSHSIRPPGWKKAMCPQNIGFIRALFENAISYINCLKFSSGELLVQSRRKTGFIGLIINMKSALALYEDMVENTHILKYVPLYKISQDHLELFFSSIRASIILTAQHGTQYKP